MQFVGNLQNISSSVRWEYWKRFPWSQKHYFISGVLSAFTVCDVISGVTLAQALWGTHCFLCEVLTPAVFGRCRRTRPLQTSQTAYIKPAAVQLMQPGFGKSIQKGAAEGSSNGFYWGERTGAVRTKHYRLEPVRPGAFRNIHFITLVTDVGRAAWRLHDRPHAIEHWI